MPPEKVETVRRELGELLDKTMGGGSTDFRHFGFGFLGLLRRNGIAIPGGYGLLVKSLATVEGVARRLYPDIDIMEVARPFVTRMIGDSIGRPDKLQERIPAVWRAAMRELLAVLGGLYVADRPSWLASTLVRQRVHDHLKERRGVIGGGTSGRSSRSVRSTIV